MQEDIYSAARLVAAVRSLQPSLPTTSVGTDAPSGWHLGAIRSRHRRCEAFAGPIYGETMGGTLAASGISPGDHALAGHRLEPLNSTHHPCLGLDRDPPYSAGGGEQSVSRQALDELKQQIPLLDYLEAHDWRPIRQLSRGRWMGLCPLHKDHSPSFLMDPSKNLFYCYGCGRGGDVIRFAELYHQVKFPQALDLLRHWRGSAPLLHEVASFYHVHLHRHGEAIAYLQRRGLRSPELIEHMRVGYAPGGCLRGWLMQLGYPLAALRQAGLINAAGYDTFSRRIVFPLESSFYGRSIGNAAPHRFLPGDKGGLYDWQRVRHYPEAIWVEGLFDFAVLWQAGFHNVTCSMGSHLNGQQQRQLCDSPRTVYLVFDADPNGSGQQAAQSLAGRLREQGVNVRRVSLPEGHDPNSFFVEGADAGQFQALLEASRS